MTSLAERAEFTPARELPNGKNFWSALGLFEFQGEGVAETYLHTEPGAHSGVCAVWDTGIGKTFLAMALATMLYEDDQIDLVVVIAEKNKITEWVQDFTRHTTLNAHRYHGTGRQKRLASEANLHVFVTTYETGRNELMVRQAVRGRRGKARADGPLMETLGLRHKRVLWVFDEVTRLRGRGSELHQAYDHVLTGLRRGPHHQRVLGLTATPMERDYEDAYNVGRIVCPEAMPTVAAFEETYARGRDDFGRLKFRRDREEEFARLFQGILLRKRKTDQDVLDQFPQQVEKSIWVTPSPDHAELYRTVARIFDPPDGQDDDRSEHQREIDDQRLWSILRMTAGHPAAHLHANNEVSQAIVEALGEDGLRRIRASKVEPLLEELKPIVRGQGAQVVIFTYFGQTVLHELVDTLRAHGYPTAAYHGGNSLKRNDDAREEFVSGRVPILVASDAAARGLNLQNAQYVIEYESALTHAMRTQRINRVNRIGSKHGSVTCMTMILADTIEEKIVDKVLRRNEQHDILLGDEEDGSGFVSAALRREMLEVTRSGRRRR